METVVADVGTGHAAAIRTAVHVAPRPVVVAIMAAVMAVGAMVAADTAAVAIKAAAAAFFSPSVVCCTISSPPALGAGDAVAADTVAALVAMVEADTADMVAAMVTETPAGIVADATTLAAVAWRSTAAVIRAPSSTTDAVLAAVNR